VSLNAAILERHLDITPLRGRRRGRVHCIFGHPDRRPSLSVDLDRGLFNCFSCGESGGLRRFAELVGETATAGPHRPRRRPESERERAWREIRQQNRRHAAFQAEWGPWWVANDHIRRCGNAARAVRQIAGRLGPDHPRTWPLLARAARVETEGFMVEAELDAILAEGPLR
jgi:hypothetical protein